MSGRFEYTSLFIDGSWRESKGHRVTHLLDSFSEIEFATVRVGASADVLDAINAARATAQSWAAVKQPERIAMVRRIADALERRQERLTDAIVSEVGMPRKLAARIQVGAPIAAWRSYADLAETFKWQYVVGHSIVRRAPLGVVACITPWNYPLHQITAKVAPALLAGCPVVLKPAELAPLSAFLLAEAVKEAGLPRGVFNLVHGSGAEIGELLTTHTEVDAISFTGSTDVGRQIAATAGRAIKRVRLELGGKSPSLVLPGANLENAVKGTLASCMLNSGQTCSALTRLLVHEEDYLKSANLLHDLISGYTMGDPDDARTRLGPLSSARQRDAVNHHISAAMTEGAELVAGGAQLSVPPCGYFVPPTVLLVNEQMRIAREEVFGPVLTVETYRTVDEAIRLANNTDYGLAGAVWAATDEQALDVAGAIRTGQVQINEGTFNPLAPFGGFKMSGIGREGGKSGIEDFTETIAFQLPARSFMLQPA